MVNIQFNIMDGLERVRKKDFIKIFIKKHPAVRPKALEKELTAINKDYGIPLYHNKGFLFKWTNLTVQAVNWGDYITSFNMDCPEHMVTVGGNYVYDSGNDSYGGMPYGIHPNIYRKNTDFRLPTVKNGHIIRMCFYGGQIPTIQRLTSLGMLHEVLQVPKNMFLNNKPGDGLWTGFRVENSCDICDDLTKKYFYNKDYAPIYRCDKCLESLGKAIDDHGNEYAEDGDDDDDDDDDI